MNNVVAIIQARLDSTRLPKKVLSDIIGKPMIIHLLERIEESKLVDKIVIATTTNESDNEIEEIVKEYGISVFRGSSEDVLDRYYNAAKENNADVVVRITADCPLLDPNILDKAIQLFKENQYDYISNVIEPTYPDGLDIEVFSFNVLKKLWEETKLKSDREHVTIFVRNNTEKFKVKNFKNSVDLSNLRWTVDHKEDLEFVRRIYERLYSKKQIFLMDDILQLLKEEPQLEEINSGIKRNEGYLISLKKDNKMENL